MICTPQSATRQNTQNPSTPISSVVKPWQTQNAASAAHLQAALLKNMQKFSKMPQSQFAYNLSVFMFYLTLNKELSLQLYNRSFMNHLVGLSKEDCIQPAKTMLIEAINNICSFWHIEQALLNQRIHNELLPLTRNPFLLPACCRVLFILASDVKKFIERGGVELLNQLMKQRLINPEFCCRLLHLLGSIIESMPTVNQCYIITQGVMETAITILKESTNAKVISYITLVFLLIGEQDNGSIMLKKLGAEKLLRKAIENPEYRIQGPELERWGIPFLESQALHTVFVPQNTIPPAPPSFLFAINWPPLLDTSSPSDAEGADLSSPTPLPQNRKFLPFENANLKSQIPIAPKLSEAAKEQLFKLGLNPNEPLFRVGRMYGSTHRFCNNCEKSGKSEELVIRPQSMTLSQYQLLINNGWYRRGGVKMYRLRCNHNVHCCDWETRVNVENFDYLTHKSYRKVLRKMPLNRLTVETKPTHFDREAFDLYNEYNMTRHNKPQMSEYSYCDHVVNSPIVNQTMDGLDYGTYHQLYKLDGKLVAVGVIDIVPTGIVSVYMWYSVSKEVMKLSFGVYSMLKEIEFVQELSKHNPRMKYYYLQGWNGNNKKLSYKANYSPEEFYCPCVVQGWVRDLAQVDSSKRKYIKKMQGEAGPLMQAIDVSKGLTVNSLDSSSSSSSGTGKRDLGKKTKEGDDEDSCISHGEESNESTISSKNTKKVPKMDEGKSEDKNDKNANGPAVYCEAFPIDMIQYQHQTGQRMVDISKIVVCLNYSEYMYLGELFQKFRPCAKQQSMMEQRFAELVVALGPELCSQLVVDLKACLDPEEVALSPESMQQEV